MKRIASFILLFALFGCGSDSAMSDKNKTTIPSPNPGGSPAAHVVLQFSNQSIHITPAEWSECVDNINYQIQHDLNPRWGCSGSAVVSSNFNPHVPSVVIQDREDGAGGYTDGTVGWCAYRANTAQLWRAYCSHVAINLLTPGYLAGQSVEAYDYRRVDYAEQPPWELADFDFPSAHGFPGVYYDYQGNPAHDLLHKLSYP